MTVVDQNIHVKASPDTVAALLFDVNNWPDIYVGLQKADADSHFPQVGSEARVTYRVAGVTFNLTFTSIDYLPDEKAVAKVDGMMSGLNTITLIPEGKDTHVKMVFEYEMPGGGVGRAIDKLLVERMNSEQIGRSLENLKALVETKQPITG